jgi:hypothetical protein
MDSNVTTLRTVVEIRGYKSGSPANIGGCPEGLKVDSVNAHTDLNQRIADKNIRATMEGRSIIVSIDLPRKDSATMRVTVSVAFVPV